MFGSFKISFKLLLNTKLKELVQGATEFIMESLFQCVGLGIHYHNLNCSAVWGDILHYSQFYILDTGIWNNPISKNQTDFSASSHERFIGWTFWACHL